MMAQRWLLVAAMAAMTLVGSTSAFSSVPAFPQLHVESRQCSKTFASSGRSRRPAAAPRLVPQRRPSGSRRLQCAAESDDAGVIGDVRLAFTWGLTQLNQNSKMDEALSDFIAKASDAYSMGIKCVQVRATMPA